MKKRYIVSFSFTKDFEEESCFEAIASAAYALKYGISEPIGLKTEIVAELPIEQSIAPAIEAPQEFADKDSGLPPVSATDIPF